jgi:putative transposase
LYRREAGRANEMWQADHCLFPIWVKDGQGKSGRPWLTVIEDDKSRALAGYWLSWSAPSAMQTALTRRPAIWRKEDPRWQVCGIPEVFYTDHGTDFTSVHLSQVGADLKMQLVYTLGRSPAWPREDRAVFGDVWSTCCWNNCLDMHRRKSGRGLGSQEE